MWPEYLLSFLLPLLAICTEEPDLSYHHLTSHLVSLRSQGYIERPGDNHFCSGAIISKRLVLTSAHCITNRNGLLMNARRILLAFCSPHLEARDKREQLLRIDSMLVYPLYERNKQDDLGVIKVRRDIWFRGHHLVSVSLGSDELDVGHDCLTIGWNHKDDALTAGQVNVEPNTALLNEGDRTELLCRYGRTINYCRIEIPGEQKVLNLSPEWSKTPGFTYYGAGLQAGQCGVTIERVKASNNGQVKCSLGVEGEELSGTIDLVVALRPQQPIIELLSKPNREGYFAEGTQFSARCSVRDGRPPANISWYIDNMPANKRTSQLEIISTPTNDNVELSTSVQEIQWHLSPEDSNRKLVCRSHHQTDRETVPPQEAAYIINVRYAPVHQPEASVYGLYLDHTAIVNITIRASPLPRIEWTIEGLVVSQGRTEGRYSAYEPQYLGNDEYNVTLAIAGLTLEDTTKIYNLRATNELGLTDYQVRISSSSKPPSNSLDVAAIVGIVVAVAVLVLVVLLVLFARATGRWCFGGKSIKTPTNETDGQNDKQLELGQQHGQNVALLETPNGITLLGASKLKEANGNGTSQERMSVERRLHNNDEDDSFEYGTDRESSVYNPTTRPLRSVLMSQAGGRNSRSSASSEAEPLAPAPENSDLLQKGNQLGIPESRFSRWLPKDKLELLEKQAMLLSGRGSKAAPATPPKPQKKVLATPTETATATTTLATPKLPQETEI